jgi:diaminopimelate epimerase
MVADAPTDGGDLKMRFYNSDGSEGEMCGNGARCLARYAFENGLSGAEVCIETVAGKVYGWRQTERLYKIRLNEPSVMDLDRPAEHGGVTYRCAYVELGDPGLPHAVVRVPGLAGKSRDELRGLGAALRSHPAFPKGANVNFYDLGADGAVRLLTYERGVEDFTLACGTGSGSTAAVLTVRGEVHGIPVALDMPGGRLQVEVERLGERVTALYLLGDTNRVAVGELTDEDLVV